MATLCGVSCPLIAFPIELSSNASIHFFFKALIDTIFYNFALCVYCSILLRCVVYVVSNCIHTVYCLCTVDMVLVSSANSMQQ